MLTIEDIRFGYSDDLVLNGISLDIQPGITAIIGPNGAGKSTLIKCLAGVLKPTGSLYFKGHLISNHKRVFYADTISYLPQSVETTAVLTVFEAVLLGLLHSLPFWVSEQTIVRVEQTLAELGIEELAPNYLHELSGGQRQLVGIAQAIIKEPELMILDEPLNNLDIQHQFEILNLARSLTRQKNLTTLIALHDLDLAVKYADSIAVLHRGKLHSFGSPKAVVTPTMIRQVYGVEADVSINPAETSFVHLKGLVCSR